MVMATINVGSGYPVDVDIFPPNECEPAFIAIQQRFAWDDPAGAIACRDLETGEKYRTDQQLITLEALVDSFLLREGAYAQEEREALAKVLEKCASKLRLACPTNGRSDLPG